MPRTRLLIFEPRFTTIKAGSPPCAQWRGGAQLRRARRGSGRERRHTGAALAGIFSVATVLRSRDETSLAVFFGKEAVAQSSASDVIWLATTDASDSGFLRDKVAVYRSVADWLMELGRIDEGLAVLQLMKTEELSDFGVRDAALAPDRAALLTDEESASRIGIRRRYRQTRSPAQSCRASRIGRGGQDQSLEREHLRMLLAGKGETEDARSARIEQLFARNRQQRH